MRLCIECQEVGYANCKSCYVRESCENDARFVEHCERVEREQWALEQELEHDG